MEDHEILRLFLLRSENAISELSQKYGGLCMKLAFNILGDREDAEECINDAYLAVWNSIPPQRPDPLAAYLLKIVRNISLNRCRHNFRKKRLSTYDLCIDEWESSLASAETPDHELDAKITAGYISDFLRTLDQTTQMLFIRRYWYLDSYERLAEISGMREGAIRTRLSRSRAALMKYLKERGVTC